MTNPYDIIATWYDREHADFSADLELYRGYAEAANGPILEVGCGSGRLLIPLAAEGYALTGIDTSAVMLERCRATAQTWDAPVTLVQADMTDFYLSERHFALIYVALGTFNHLSSLADRRASLQTMRAHARAGATLIIDIAQAEPRQIATLADSGLLLHSGTWFEDDEVFSHSIAARPDHEPGAYRLTHWYDRHRQDGPLTRTACETTLSIIGYTEMILLLESTGWHLRRTFGDHDLSEWDEQAPRLILLAQAAER